MSFIFLCICLYLLPRILNIFLMLYSIKKKEFYFFHYISMLKKTLLLKKIDKFIWLMSNEDRTIIIS